MTLRKCQLRCNFATIGSWPIFGESTRAKEYCLVSSATSTTLQNSKVLYKSSKLLQSLVGIIFLDTYTRYGVLASNIYLHV